MRRVSLHFASLLSGYTPMLPSKNLITHVKNNEQGGVAIAFAIGISTMAIIIAAGIDYARLTNAREKLQWAVDGTALATKRTHVDTRRKMGEAPSRDHSIGVGRKVFDANLSGMSQWFVGGSGSASFGWSGEDVASQVTGTANVPLVFGGLIGYSTVPIRAYAEVGLGQTLPTEISLVLDNTASMFFKDGRPDTRFTLLRNASKKFVNALYDGSVESERVRVAVVPWASTVNVKSEKPLPWNVGNKQSAVLPDHGSRQLPDTSKLISRAGTVSVNPADFDPVNWRGCISGAGESTGFTDAPPASTFKALAVPKVDLDIPGYIKADIIKIQVPDECIEHGAQVCTPDPPPGPSSPPGGGGGGGGPPTGGGGGGGGGGLSGFQPTPLVIPISIQNLAPRAMHAIDMMMLAGCYTPCNKWSYKWITIKDCKPSNRIPNPECKQEVEYGKLNKYNDLTAAPYDKCVTKLGDDCDEISKFSFSPLGACVADPNEIAYNNSGGRWCPWITDKTWNSFDKTYGHPIAGPNLNCPMPMLGLTGNRNQLLATLDRMSPVPGGTHADIGLRWGLRTLSPDPYWTAFFHLDKYPAEPWAGSSKNKVLLLITDGENTSAVDVPGYWGCNGTVSGSKCTGTKSVAELNTQMLNWCSAIREKGVRIITVALNVGNKDAVKLLVQCSGNPNDSHDIDATQLDELLKEIAETTLLRLHLRK